MTLCPYTQLGCETACKAHQNNTCPFDKLTSPLTTYAQHLQCVAEASNKAKRGRKPKQ